MRVGVTSKVVEGDLQRVAHGPPRAIVASHTPHRRLGTRVGVHHLVELELAVASRRSQRQRLDRVGSLLVHRRLNGGVGVRAGDRAIVGRHRVRLGQPHRLVHAVFGLDALEDAVHAVHVVRRPIQVQRDDVVVEVVRGGVRILRQNAEHPVVEERPIVVDVYPVRRARERHHRRGVGLPGRQVRHFEQLGEFCVRAQPRVAAACAGVARLELRLVPHDPLIDLSGVVLRRLVHVLAEVVVRIVEWQAQVLGNRPLAVVGLGSCPRWRELKQASHVGAAIQLGLDLVPGQGLAQVTEVARFIRLNLVPRQDQAFPTGADVRHHAGVAIPLGNTESGIDSDGGIRGLRMRGHDGADDDREAKQTAQQLGCAHGAPFLTRADGSSRLLSCVDSHRRAADCVWRPRAMQLLANLQLAGPRLIETRSLVVDLPAAGK